MALRLLSKARARTWSSKKKASSNEPPPRYVSASFSALPEKDVKDFGYGRASPSPSPSLRSEVTSSKYEYGNGNPASEDASKYGYRDASPETASQYGYGDAAPSDGRSNGRSNRPSKTTRRSSTKQGRTVGRRASTGCTGELNAQLPGQRNDPLLRRTRTCSNPFSCSKQEDEVKGVERASYHGDASPETASQYGYGVAAPSDCGSSRSSMTPRRSSMKQGNTTGRRASIGCTSEIEVKLPGQRDPVRRRRSISFLNEDDVKEVACLSSLTDDSEALWFQNEEIQNIKAELRAIVVAVERGDDDARNICTRGLECHIGRSSKTNINAAWDAVVLEQCMQQNKGSFDDETISMRYKIFARLSRVQAAERAKEDEAAIAKYQRDTRRMVRRMSM
jgi:hypothetical protein